MTPPPAFSYDLDELRRFLETDGASKLPGTLGVEIVEIDRGRCSTRLEIGTRHLAPNGYLHAASVVALADSAAGYGCVASLPEGAVGFTTVELKSNFLRTQLEGRMVAQARLAHGGRTTQVWDAEVRSQADDRLLALFRCTQLLVYPRP